MDRHKFIISRVEEDLRDEGFVKKEIFTSSENGFGDLKSFFEVMIDLRLQGEKDISPEQVWEDMKKQINFLKISLVKAAEDYRKLENNYRGLKKDYEELIKTK